MTDVSMPAAPSVWHAGERAIQEAAGVADRMEAVGRSNVRAAMPDQHRAFYAQLPFVVAGSVDRDGAPWATLVAGRPGFVASPAPTILEVAAVPDPADPAAEGLREGDAVGLLGIELGTRRRNRVNGVLRASGPDGLRIEVGQSFGNCPRHIRPRDAAFVRDPCEPSMNAAEERADLDAAARAAVAAADTFFVASHAERGGWRQVDVSHRGGERGFVRVGADGALTIPDFAGNLFFMTLGNIWLSGKAGLVFVDWGTGDLLQMTGDAAVALDAPDVAAFAGAERLWTFRPRRVVRRRGALPLRWSPRADGGPPRTSTAMSTTAPTTAGRDEAAARWRPFRVAAVVDESRTVRSLRLRPDDGAALVTPRAGQHVPLRVTLPGAPGPLIRTYTLSSAPSDADYRVSVKRDGPVSRHLHDLAVGDAVNCARQPAASRSTRTSDGPRFC